MVFERFKKLVGRDDDFDSEFIEIDLDQDKADSKVLVKTFILKTYDDINPILDSLRSGYTITVIDIKALKAKDVVELKRAISKIKKTVDALEGRIAGFGEHTVIATPSKVFEIQKGIIPEEIKEDESMERF
ncbi:hypothetical protein CMI37_26565 [Candidatus Pacearchaeota archaeon]|nr:hypothetical protein [Candidatus Pacearchaeota archaeon]|tara:strand:+ start:6760 stop:7152 length:393 start_codon:yes stop_codon:yes gene_type:complete